MYLQITTKCNMKCAHCCYSCNKNGKHMPRNVWQDAIRFAEKWDSEVISIGGGEPTLHPDFFEILQRCMWGFSYVWMATNGSRTKTMRRLVNILNGEDYYNGEENAIIPEKDQFSVELSTDYYHDPISDEIRDYWERMTKAKRPGFGLRDVTQGHGPVEQGRAKRTSSAMRDGCCCPELTIRPDGKIKVCGCTNSPIIGDIWNGIEREKFEAIEEDEDYQNTRCYFGKT